LRNHGNSAQAYLSHQQKWKENLIKQAQKTISDRIKRENHLKEKKVSEEKRG